MVQSEKSDEEIESEVERMMNEVINLLIALFCTLKVVESGFEKKIGRFF